MKTIYKLSNKKLSLGLEGEIDEHSAGYFRRELEKIFELGNFNMVIFDFSKVTFMDSTGIGMLLGRYKYLKQNDIAVFVENVPPQVDKIFVASGLYEVFLKI